MIILAIETSCDETAIAVVKASGITGKPVFKILSNVVSSQIAVHAPWGGVVPHLAKREHIKNLPVVLKKVLKESSIKQNKIDTLAVTSGPGLEPALWTGINFAQELAKKWKKPVVAVNHMEGHLFAAFLPKSGESTKHQKTNSKSLGFDACDLRFPLVALLVSGGHTQLILVKKIGQYQLIGETLDDAAGEAFDKAAKMLGLGYPGGPAISKMAEKFEARNSKHEIKLPRPMFNTKDFNFSFSGLKTALLYFLRDLEEKFRNSSDSSSKNRSKNYETFLKDLTPAICKEFQQAIVDVLLKKTFRAVEQYRAKSIILGGGVAANDELRWQFAERVKTEGKKINLIIPEKALTTDNAAMIAAAAYSHALKKEFVDPSKITADGNLSL